MKTLFTTIALVLATSATTFAQQTNSTPSSLSCPVLHEDARLIGPPVVDRPVEADGSGGTSIVKVTLTPNGTVAKASIVQSSYDFWLDTAALQASRSFKYQPETEECAGVSGSYLVDFSF